MIKINKSDGTEEIIIKLEHDSGDLWYATNLEGVVYQTTLDDVSTPQQCEAVETKNMATETLSVIKEKYGLGSRNVMKELLIKDQGAVTIYIEELECKLEEHKLALERVREQLDTIIAAQ